MLNKQNLKDLFSLSPMQEGMMFYSQFNEGAAAYVEQTCVDVKGNFDPEIFRKSWELIVEKYDAFRSVFITKKSDRPLQVVLKEYPLEYTFKDFSSISGRLLSENLREFKTKDIQKGFDLATGPLFRLSILKTGDDTFQTIWTFHHIILDGWSLGIVLNDLTHFYKKLLEGDSVKVLPNSEYSKYVKWLQSVDKTIALNYWRNFLKSAINRTLVPTKVKKESQSIVSKALNFVITSNQIKKITEFSNSNDLTLNSFFQTLWASCLQLWTGNNTIVFGSTISGRNIDLPNVEQMVGLMINTIPLLFKFDANSTFLSVAKEFQRSFLESEKYGHCSLAQIQKESVLQNDLINHLLVFENYPLDGFNKQIEKLGFSIKEADSFEHSEYKFEVVVEPGDEFNIRVQFDENTYDEKVINEIFEHFISLSDLVLSNSNKKLIELNKVSFTCIDGNDSFNSKSNENRERIYNVVKMLEDNCIKHPNHIAIVVGEKQLTYSELSHLINIFSGNLKNVWGVKKGDRIGVLLDRNEFSIALYFSILKLGCTYVPIDPTYPVDKIEFMLKDSNASTLILDKKNLSKLSNDSLIDIVLLDDLLIESILHLDIETDLSNCAYIIYTSGSTGVPKGCQVSNLNLASLIHNAPLNFEFSEKDVWITTHSFCFDFSVWEMYGCLCYGGKLVVATFEDVKDTKKFIEILDTQGVTVLNQTPPSFYRLISEDSSHSLTDSLEKLKYVIFGGDRLDMVPLQDWIRKHPLNQTKLINMFGITETTVHVTFKDLSVDDINDSHGLSPVGMPLPDYQVYILDEFMRSVPNNVTGEMYVGGSGVSLGYYNREDLNQQRFVDNPFSPGQKLYRSGDVAFRNDKEIFYLGRNDDQIQLRGFRVELGEIAHRIETHPDVEKSFVLSVKDGLRDDLLVGFYVSRAGQDLKYEEIYSWLQAHLAEYMIPRHIHRVDSFSLTNNGKINRRDLIDLHHKNVNNVVENNYAEPITDLQKSMCTIWKEILEIDKIGITNNFFELGGHSIKAILLSSSMSKKMNLSFNLREIFEFPTIEKLSYYAQFKKPEVFASISPCLDKSFDQLSNAQKRLWLVDKIGGPSANYNVQGGFEIFGVVDEVKLKKVLNQIVSRHQSLRTNFVEFEELPVQKIHEELQVEIIKNYASSEKEVRELILKEISMPFDLAKDSLVRFSLYEIRPEYFVFSVCIHHIICDGWSVGVFISELSRLYNDEILEPLKIQYRDFVYWQNRALNSPIMNTQRDYWLRVLEGDLPTLQMPTDYNRPEKRNFSGSSYHFEIPQEISIALKKYLEKRHHSLFMGLFSAYALLLHKYSNQSDIMIGVPVSGRYHPDLEDQIGYYLNTLPLRVKLDASDSAHDYIYDVSEMIKSAFENQVYPFDLILENTTKSRGIDRKGLYDVMFSLQNYAHNSLDFKNLSVKTYDVDIPICKFDMSMICLEKDSGQIGVSIEFSTELFELETIERFSSHFTELIKSICNNPTEKISNISLLSDAENELVTKVFSGANELRNLSFDHSKSIIDYFMSHVEEDENKIAILSDGEKVTYGELNKRANIIANHLIHEEGVQKEEPVCLFFNKNLEMIVAIIGVLKAGGCYVPIDTNNPDARLSSIFEMCKNKVLITEDVHFNKIKELFSNSITISSMDAQKIENPSVNISGSDLAYIMFTSGSTGQPKGAMIEHHSVISLVVNERLDIASKDDCFLQMSSFAFDASVYDVFSVLVNGASIYVAHHEKVLSPDYLAEVIENNGINKVILATAMFNALTDFDDKFFKNFDRVYFGGQECSVKHVNKALKNMKEGASLYNLYGPTEACTLSTSFPIKEEYSLTRAVPIGSYILKDELFILNEQMMPVPVGVIGDLYISGLGVGRGYINNQKATKENFRPNEFGGKYPLYKTNDLARWRNDGQILFHGRKDHQIKIRGFRVELGEIESAMLLFPNILNACVVDFDSETSNNIELAAYFVASAEVSIPELKKFLSTFVPTYMIPSIIVQLDALPLNNSGKVDKKKLSQNVKLVQNEVVEQPTNSHESVLQEVWSVTLNKNNIGINDNYFALGGDSIKAIQMVAKLREKKYRMSISDLYKFPTIAELANCLSSTLKILNNEVVVGETPLGAVHCWYTDLMKGPFDFFNQDLLIEINKEVSFDHINQALMILMSSHDVLRSEFSISDNQMSSTILEKLDPALMKCSILNSNELRDVCLNVNESIKIEKGPLIKGAFIESAQQNYFYIVMHHFIVDGVSWRIIMDDLQIIISNLLNNNNDLKISERTTSFKKWTEELSETKIFDDQISYWSDVIDHDQKVFEGKSEKQTKCNTCEALLDSDYTYKLLGEAQQAYNTKVTDLLLMSLNISLSEALKSSSSLIYLEGHGREELFEHLDISHTVGWFTSVYPVKLSYSKDLSLDAQIKHFKESLRKLPNNGIGYGVLKYLKKRSELQKKVKPVLSFNYLGQFDEMKEDGFMQVSQLKTCETMADSLVVTTGIEISCFIRSGELCFNLTSSNQSILPGAAKELLQSIIENLKIIIDHCLNTSDGGITPSDIDFDEFDINTLDNVLDNI